MSVLESCNIMRGFKSGVEVRLRERAPLFDIDGDTFHHAHNAAKEFCKPNDKIQSNLVISNSLISNYRLSRSENLVPVLT